MSIKMRNKLTSCRFCPNRLPQRHTAIRSTFYLAATDLGGGCFRYCVISSSVRRFQ